MAHERDRQAEAAGEDQGEYNVVELPSSVERGREPALCRGRLLSWDSEQGAEVDYPGNPHGPIAASSLVAWSPAEVAEIIHDECSIALGFEGGRSDRPIIMGVLYDPRQLAAEREGESAPSEGLIDGDQVSLRGKERVELRCGKASITLTKNGRIVIRGTELSSRSTGTNRIRGGSIELN